MESGPLGTMCFYLMRWHSRLALFFGYTTLMLITMILLTASGYFNGGANWGGIVHKPADSQTPQTETLSVGTPNPNTSAQVLSQNGGINLAHFENRSILFDNSNDEYGHEVKDDY